MQIESYVAPIKIFEYYFAPRGSSKITLKKKLEAGLSSILKFSTIILLRKYFT